MARLFPKFPLHSLGGVLARVERTRGGFEQDSLCGVTPLFHQQDSAPAVHRNDDYGTWVFDDLTFSRLAIANLNGVDAQGEDLPVVYPLRELSVFAVWTFNALISYPTRRGLVHSRGGLLS